MPGWHWRLASVRWKHWQVASATERAGQASGGKQAKVPRASMECRIGAGVPVNLCLPDVTNLRNLRNLAEARKKTPGTPPGQVV